MKQRDMGLLGPTQAIEMVPSKLIQRCQHRGDAIRLCIAWSGQKLSFIADMLGIDRGQMTRITGGTSHFPDRKDDDLMRICKNYAPMQYSAWRFGFDLQERSKDARIREMEQELAKLRASDEMQVAA